METQAVPWLFALVTAAWFWWMADRAHRTRTLWAVGGGAFGLVISTLIIGLGQARRIGFSDHHRSISELKWEVFAAVVIVIGGWILTAGLHRYHLALWKKLRPSAPAAEPNAVSVRSAPAASKPGVAKPQPSSQR